MDNYSVTLKDLATNITVDIKKGDIMVFNSPAGTIEDRFVLTVSNLTTGLPPVNIPDKKFSIYSTSGILNILSLTDDFINSPGSITIYDLSGRKIKQQTNLLWNGSGELKQISLGTVEKGMIFVEIKAGNKKYVEKVNFNK